MEGVETKKEGAAELTLDLFRSFLSRLVKIATLAISLKTKWFCLISMTLLLLGQVFAFGCWSPPPKKIKALEMQSRLKCPLEDHLSTHGTPGRGNEVASKWWGANPAD